jgi:hypothetical protein
VIGAGQGGRAGLVRCTRSADLVACQSPRQSARSPRPDIPSGQFGPRSAPPRTWVPRCPPPLHAPEGSVDVGECQDHMRAAPGWPASAAHWEAGSLVKRPSSRAAPTAGVAARQSAPDEPAGCRCACWRVAWPRPSSTPGPPGARAVRLWSGAPARAPFSRAAMACWMRGATGSRSGPRSDAGSDEGSLGGAGLSGHTRPCSPTRQRTPGKA